MCFGVGAIGVKLAWQVGLWFLLCFQDGDVLVIFEGVFGTHIRATMQPTTDRAFFLNTEEIRQLGICVTMRELRPSE
jgi:hypothetical protein